MSTLNDVPPQNVPPSNNKSIPEDAAIVAQKLRSQVEFYFSATNLARDGYLVQFLQTTGAVPLGIIANFPKVRRILAAGSLDATFLVQSLQESSVVAMSPDGSWLIPRTPPMQQIPINMNMNMNMIQPPPPVPMQLQYPPHAPAYVATSNNEYNTSIQNSTTPKTRNTIILREVPSKTTASDILSTFSTAKSVKADVGSTWFVTFDSEEDAVEAVSKSKDYTLHGQLVKARIKSESPPPPVVPSATTAPAMYAHAHPGAVLPVYHNNQHHPYNIVPTYYTYTQQQQHQHQHQPQPVYNSGGKHMQQQTHYHQRLQNNNYGHGAGGQGQGQGHNNMNGRYRRNGGGGRMQHHQQQNNHHTSTSSRGGHNYHHAGSNNHKSHYNGPGAGGPSSNTKGNNYKAKPSSVRTNRNGNSNNSNSHNPNTNVNANVNSNAKTDGGVSTSTSTSTSPSSLFDASNDFPVLHGSNSNRVSATTTGYADALLNKQHVNEVHVINDKDELVQALKAATLEPVVVEEKVDKYEKTNVVEKPAVEKNNYSPLQGNEDNHQNQKEEKESLNEVEHFDRIKEDEVKPAGAWGSKRLFADVVKQP